MKLWLITRPEEQVDYDETAGFIIRAETEDDARLIAHNETNRERGHETWKTSASCIELTGQGDPGIVLRDFNAG